MQHLLKEVDKMLQLNADDRPLICGVGLGGYWAERIGFFAISARRFLIQTCFRMKTWKAKSTGRKSMLTSPPSA
jgi:hypothetical protein